MSQKVMNSYDSNVPDWFFNQSAVIPFRIQNNELEILLITSIKKKHWIIPKGIIETNLRPQESAAKEAYEEAGISGHVYETSIGNYTYEKWGGICQVLVFPFRVDSIHETWPESNLRKRKWYTVNEAIKIVNKSALVNMIKSLEQVYLK